MFDDELAEVEDDWCEFVLLACVFAVKIVFAVLDGLVLSSF